MNRQSATTRTRSFIAAVWADCRTANRLLVEHQMGPKHPNHS